MDAIQVYTSKAMAMLPPGIVSMMQADEFWTLYAPLGYVAIIPFVNVLIAMASPLLSPPRTGTYGLLTAQTHFNWHRVCSLCACALSLS